MSNARNLWHRYLLALSLIAVLAVTVFYTSNHATDAAQTHAEASTLTNRQKELALKIILLSHTISESRSAEIQKMVAGKISTAIKQFEYSHRLLTLGDKNSQISGNLPKPLIDLYYGPEKMLNRHITLFLRNVRQLLSGSAEEKTKAFTYISDHSEMLFSNLDLAAKEFARLEFQASSQLRLVGFLAFLAVIFIIVCEAVFIFWPAQKQIIRTIAKLIETRNEIEQQKENAERAQKRFDAVFDNAESIIYVKKVGGELLHANRRFCQQFGFKRDHVIGKNEADLFGDDYATEWQKEDRKIVSSPETFQTEEMIPNSSGTKNYFITQKYRIYDPVQKKYVITVQSTDVTQKRASEDRIRKLAFHDELTNLPNRACCTRDIRKKFSDILETDTFSIIHLDIDNFKRTNDSLGHAAGDKLLVEVGRRLRLKLKGLGRAYRWGGDEFIIIIDNIGKKELAECCEEITDLLSIQIKFKKSTLWPTASLGVARFPDDGTDFDTLMIHADLALYKSKQSGRDGFHFFTKDMKTKIDEEARLESELRLALEKKQLFLVYQPQLDIETGAITGLEALVRWQHPEKGILSPTSFLGVVESTRLSSAVGRYVVDNALSAARRWMDQAIEFGRIAINLSPGHLKTGDFLNDILEAIENYSIPPSRIKTEVLESLILEDSDTSILNVLEHLHNTGVQVELDDFGTGYASFSHISTLPINGLKIDKSFVNKMLLDEKKAIVVRSLVSLANLLKLNVICEGVETQEQLEKLRQFGHSSVQGYLISRPKPFNEMTEWLKSEQCFQFSHKEKKVHLLAV